MSLIVSIVTIVQKCNKQYRMHFQELSQLIKVCRNLIFINYYFFEINLFFILLENLISMITEFVITGNHEFSIVEGEKFKIIIQKGFSNRQCLFRKTLMSKISTTANDLKSKL